MTVEEGAGKRCSERVSDCGGRCRKAMLGVWARDTVVRCLCVGVALSTACQIIHSRAGFHSS